jgi:toxin ParE1/3/4
MAEYSFTNKAVDDLNRIWLYTFNKWSEKQADKYFRMLIKYCENAAANPEIGKNYARIYTDLLGIKTGRHIIFYRKTEKDAIEILRILHEQMDIKTRLKE